MHVQKEPAWLNTLAQYLNICREGKLFPTPYLPSNKCPPFKGVAPSTERKIEHPVVFHWLNGKKTAAGIYTGKSGREHREVVVITAGLLPDNPGGCISFS